ncbi:MAG: hypothetical protein J6J35_04775 [Alphaproteobacteria bacterium]|nr:hypothetical protein [Alphaproteobacteria bacterium]
MSDKREMKSPGERIEGIKARKKAYGLTGEGGVQDRLAKIATQTVEAPVIANDQKKDKKKPISMEDLAKRMKKFDEKIAKAEEKHGIKLSKLSKDGKENNKDKEKDEQKKDKAIQKAEAKMKEMFSKIKLPSGMEIHQEGPQWVLVSKDGKQRTDVTDVMNTIDKFNRNIDATNEANRVQNAAQGKADNVANNVANDANRTDIMKDSGFKVNATNDKAMMVGEVLPKVKDVNGNQVFKPEDAKAVAEIGLGFSDEKAKLEKLKDPKALEEMRKREKRNENEADRQAMLARSQEQSRGGR